MDKSGLNGTLPTEIAALTSLREFGGVHRCLSYFFSQPLAGTLALHFNELSGLLPTEVGTLTELSK